jgi:hypothetical protein
MKDRAPETSGAFFFSVFQYNPRLPEISVTRTYLEMYSPDELRSAERPSDAPRIDRVEECPASFFRYLYAEWVGPGAGFS